MKTVLLIGKNGFLGSRIFFFLKKKKFKIIAPNRKQLDLLSKKNIKKFINRNLNSNINYIINSAAYIGGQGLIENNSMKVMISNTQMTINLHEIIKNFNLSIKKIIFIGSACAYPNSNTILKEKNFWDGQMFEGVESYGIVKKFDFIYQKEIKKKFNINYLNYSLANLYGPNDKFDIANSHVLGSLVSKIFTAKKKKLPSVEVWGTGRPVRDFLYIDDAALVISRTFEKMNGLVNVGSGKSITIKNLAHLIANLCKYKGKIFFNRKKADGVQHKVLSNALLSKYYNVNEFTSLRNGIIRTLRWFKVNML